MPDEQRAAARAAIRQAVLRRCRELTLPPDATVAAYQPLRTEPGSVELLAGLAHARCRVIVPVTLADRDLDWTRWPASDLPSDLLGVAEVGRADLVLVPAFAVDRAGRRLGRGGGSYDRALARVRSGVPVAALLYRPELVDRVPVDPWDQPVTAVVTPDGWQDLTPTGRGNS